MEIGSAENKTQYHFPNAIVIDSNTIISADESMFYYRDLENEVKWEDVQKRKFFFEWKKVPSDGYHFGRVQEPIWLGVTIQNRSDHPQLYKIRFLYPFIDHIQFYTLDEGLVYDTGLKYPLETRYEMDSRFVFPLELKEYETKTFFFRVDTRTAFASTTEIYTDSINIWYELSHHLPLIVYASVASGLFFYNVFIYFSLRLRDHLFYSLFILTFTGYQFFINGYGYLFITDNHGINQGLVHTLFQFAVFFHISYSLEILSLQDYRPRLYIWMMRLRYLVFPGVVFYFIGYHYIEKLMINFTNGLLFLILLGIGLDSIRINRGFKWIFLLGWSAFITGVLLFISLAMGWIPFSRENIQIIQFTNSLELFTLSFVLSYKLRFVRNNPSEDFNHSQTEPSRSSHHSRTETTQNSQGKRKYLKGIDPETIQIKLEHLLSHDEIYKNENLRMEDLARMLDIGRHQFSAFFSEHLQTNYYDCITKWRLDCAEQLLQSSDKMSLIEICYECGFSSKSTFYDAFQKRHGMPPGKYRRNFRK